MVGQQKSKRLYHSVLRPSLEVLERRDVLRIVWLAIFSPVWVPALLLTALLIGGVRLPVRHRGLAMLLALLLVMLIYPLYLVSVLAGLPIAVLGRERVFWQSDTLHVVSCWRRRTLPLSAVLAARLVQQGAFQVYALCLSDGSRFDLNLITPFEGMIAELRMRGIPVEEKRRMPCAGS